MSAGVTGDASNPAFTDPRLVALYDTDNPPGADHDYYRGLADELDARTVIDLGCGTGSLTVTYARDGRSVTGIDPSAAMLDVARHRAGGEQVAWVLGDASAIEATRKADLAVMTGNAIQALGPAQFDEAVEAVAGALRPGGVFAFETRNPADRAWEEWAREEPTIRDTEHGPLREWLEIAPPGQDGTVRMRCHSLFESTGERVTELMELTFRDRHTLTNALTAAGFAEVHVWRDWRRTPFEGEGRIMVVEARRAG